MGDEAKCIARIGGKRLVGKALLETSELIFRGPEQRLKIQFVDMKNVTAADGELRVKTKDGEFVFQVGSAAEKWREKILHPKTRIEKLGVKPGMRVALVGDAETTFVAELQKCKADIATGAQPGRELTFLFVEAKNGLREVENVAKRVKGPEGLWVVYPKGKKEITETGVIESGRKAGLKDVKVVGFSPTHTALKFVIPVEKR